MALRLSRMCLRRLGDGPGLKHFLAGHAPHAPATTPNAPTAAVASAGKVWLETYGCQMNVADSEIVRSVLSTAGYQEAKGVEDADVILLNTCAIRDNAESRVWQRLRQLRGMRQNGKQPMQANATVGVLGCMAERLKDKLLEEESLSQLVVGPDAYRDLPRLLEACRVQGESAINVQLSVDETYADIAPVRTATNGVSAFVSIMRGCNNMCAFCIVPFTRGRERSRDVASIVREVCQLRDQGFKEVTLLGQNVNSYADLATPSNWDVVPKLSAEFHTIYKPNRANGVRFAELLATVADAAPSVRFRFTSPHPKDFPDELLHVIASRPNVCSQLHLPAQSGSTRVLEAMRRGYSREAYLALAHHIRHTIPGVALSSDFIAGFCGETEEDHEQTLSLLREVRFEHAFMFAYSMRERTHAHRRLVDDVPPDVKQRRLQEVISTFYSIAHDVNQAEIGNTHHVLIDKLSKRSDEDWAARTDTNKRVVFPRNVALADLQGNPRELALGDVVAVKVTEASSQTLKAVPLHVVT